MMDKEMKERVITAIQCTYEYIASDLAECSRACGEEFTLEHAIEGAIDADRVVDYGHDKEAAAALHALKNCSAMKKLGKEALKEYF